MKFKFFYIALVLVGCSESTRSLKQDFLVPFHGDKEFFFPTNIFQNADKTLNKNSRAEYYSNVLRRLKEEPLSDRFRDMEVIRLTVLKSFGNPSTIVIQRQGSKILLVEKETYPDKRVVSVDTTIGPIYECIEFDSIKHAYELVKRIHILKSDLTREIERLSIDPLTKRREMKLDSEKWNNLVGLLNENSFMGRPNEMEATGFDGTRFLLEIHSKGGYYAIDRRDHQRDEDLSKIFNYILSLTK